VAIGENGALQLDEHEASVVSLAQEIEAWILNSGQFDLDPLFGRYSGQFVGRGVSRSSQ
jgi:hypothetical protein